jgi:hypothetical protein
VGVWGAASPPKVLPLTFKQFINRTTTLLPKLCKIVEMSGAI